MPDPPSRLEISAMGGVRPPIAATLSAARTREEQGFDAIWWADHLLHWFPLSIWTPDLVPQAAAGQRTPHVWFDPFPVIAAAAGVTSEARLGVGVTDLVRHHPAALAQSALTLDHVTGGRFLLGIGTGEALNLAPIGLQNERPAARLAEGLAVIRRLFDTDGPVDFDGEFFTLRDMSLGLRPEGATPPPIWVAAHRPKTLAVAGTYADGWLPIATDPDDYSRMLTAVRTAAARADRSEDAVTPGLYARIVIADTRARALAALDDSLLMRFIALTRPAEAFARHGAEHPLGARAFGLTTLLPTRYERAEALALTRQVPDAVVHDSVLVGTPDDIAASVDAFVAAGARHVQLTNMTPLADPSLAADSERLLQDLVRTLRGRVGR